MASFADLLTPKSRQVFDGIVAEEVANKEHIFQERQERIRKNFEKNGFKSFEELIEYLQTTGKRVYVTNCNDHGIYLQWDAEENKIRHHVYENDSTDMTIGYYNYRYTIEEFLKKFQKTNDVLGRDAGINEWGYVDAFIRDDEHPVDDYKMDDRFFPIL